MAVTGPYSGYTKPTVILSMSVVASVGWVLVHAGTWQVTGIYLSNQDATSPPATLEYSMRNGASVVYMNKERVEPGKMHSPDILPMTMVGIWHRAWQDGLYVQIEGYPGA